MSFESDDIKSFRKVLETLVDVSMDRGIYSVKFKHDGCFDDGSEHKSGPSILIGPREDSFHFIGNERCYHGATFVSTTREFQDKDVAAKESYDQDSYTVPTRMFVAGLRHEYKDVTLATAKIRCGNSKKKMIDAALEVLASKENRKAFFDKCGNGYTSWFSNFDGSIDIGYRLSWNNSIWDEGIDLSLCHIYYGK